MITQKKVTKFYKKLLLLFNAYNSLFVDNTDSASRSNKLIFPSHKNLAIIASMVEEL